MSEIEELRIAVEANEKDIDDTVFGGRAYKAWTCPHMSKRCPAAVLNGVVL